MEYKKLEEISDIQSGLILSRKIMTNEKKKYRYKALTLRSFNSSYISKDLLDDFDSKEELKENYLTQQGDVIFRLFSPFNSTLITKKETGYVIPNLFGVIRLKDKDILPGYINALINSKVLKVNELSERVGQVTQSVFKIKIIKEINVPIIPMEQQLIIEKIYNEQNKLNILYNELITKENIKIKNIINQILEKQNDK